MHDIAQALERRSIARTLAMHRLAVEKIRRDPELFEKARRTLARWRTIVCKSTQPYLVEWEALMNEGMDACLTFALEDSEHAADMRQSSPLVCVLANEERLAFLKEWKRKVEAR
ncbi:hypothetical protein [Achromobacter deleyi]|uniref:hypothetical protein n=1 Tax=Achromobacter deleyi TaxID=1353891 RepID=UPI001491DD72|nr:hypothetical protein [Achromobacter deleyi]QVQ24728.1 hypothetical protein HLG70_17740 [Achromobacter deleyi]UIP20265.1 hypothetical protein LYZ39_25355 [Achromobacter deleyi]